MDPTVDVTRSRSQWWRVFVPSVRLVSATIIIGAVGGAIVGGLGGRVAMRVLFLTSDDAVKGVTSDDGFEIGRFTLSNTVGLVIVTMFIGVLAALLYLVAHPFVARWGRARVPAMATFYGVVGGAMLVHTDGVDFKLLEPAVLAIALFVAISAGFGAVVAHLVGLAAADGAWPQRWHWWALGPPMLFLLVPPFLVVALVGFAVHHAATTTEPNARWWRVARKALLSSWRACSSSVPSISRTMPPSSPDLRRPRHSRLDHIALERRYSGRRATSAPKIEYSVVRARCAQQEDRRSLLSDTTRVIRCLAHSHHGAPDAMLRFDSPAGRSGLDITACDRRRSPRAPVRLGTTRS